MTMSELSRYVDKFTKLRRDPAKGWPAATRGKSPYKPLLLLAVLDQFDQGQITRNLIELTPDLGNLFDLYCATVGCINARPLIVRNFIYSLAHLVYTPSTLRRIAQSTGLLIPEEFL